jgi:hypothetical protein
MKMKAKRKSFKGKVVYDRDEFIEREDFTRRKKEIPNSRSKPKGVGIYALYDNYGLYYVGKTDRSLRGRIQEHIKADPKVRWKRFSWYRFTNYKDTKDVESILLRIINPKRNRVKGKFPHERKRKRKRLKR